MNRPSLNDNKYVSYKDQGMSKDHKYQIFVIFISIYAYMAIYIISNTSLDYAKGFKVPKESIELYISKIDTYRTVFIILGSIIAHILNYFFVNYSNFFATGSFIFLFMTRFAYLVFIYMPFTTSIGVLKMMNYEAFLFGFFQISLFALFPQYMSLILFSNDLSRIFVFVCQTLLCLTDIKSIYLVKWLWYISVPMGIIPLGMLCFYIFDSEGPFLRDTILPNEYKLKQITKVSKEVPKAFGEIPFMIYKVFEKIQNFKNTIHFTKLMKDICEFEIEVKKLREFKFSDEYNNVNDEINNICDEMENLAKLEGVITLCNIIKTLSSRKDEKEKRTKYSFEDALNAEFGLLERTIVKVKPTFYHKSKEYLEYVYKLFSKIKDMEVSDIDVDLNKIESPTGVEKIRKVLDCLIKNFDNGKSSYKPSINDEILGILNIKTDIETTTVMDHQLKQNQLLKQRNNNFIILVEDIELALSVTLVDKMKDIKSKLHELRTRILESRIKVVFGIKVSEDAMDVPNSESSSETRNDKEELIGKFRNDLLEFIKSYFNTITKTIEERNTKNVNSNFYEYLIKSISPFMMVFVASFFKEFLYAGVTPYGLLDIKECAILMKIMPFVFVIGSMAVLYVDKHESTLKKWKWYHNLIWIFAVPMVVIFIFSIITIHSKIPFFNNILNSKSKVYSMTIILIFCYSILICFSYVGVANNVCYNFVSNKSISILTCQNILSILMSYLFFKISVGYNNTRSTYGYILPNFHPTRDSKNTLWFWLSKTIMFTYNDIFSDFKSSINITE